MNALAAVLVLWAGGAAAEPSPQSFQSLQFGAGARAAAMAGAYSAVADDANAIYWNPAGLGRVSAHDLTFMHVNHVEGSTYDFGAYAQPVGQGGAGASLQYFSYGKVGQFDASGNPAGAFTPNDMAAAVGYGRRLDGPHAPPALRGVSLGAAVKFVRSQVGESAQTHAVDLGVSAPFFGERLRLAAAMQNLGASLRTSSGVEELAHTARFGAAVSATRRWLISSEIVTSPSVKPAASLGTEYRLDAASGWSFAMRAGVNARTLTDVGGAAGFATGIGVASKRVGVDYALVPMGLLGISNQIAVSLFL